MPHIDRSGTLVLLAYHSINEYGEDRIRTPNIVTPAAFEAQIRYLAAKYHVMALPECIARMKEGRPFPRRTAAITLDDGYKDNVVTAAPILRRYGVPATFFVVTDCMGAGRLKWEDELSCLVRRSRAQNLSLTLPSGQVSLDTGSGKARLLAIQVLVNLLGRLEPTERSQILDELRQQTKAKCDDGPGVMMTWDDVRRLADTPAFSIGSHSATHEHLSRIPRDRVVLEVTRSKERLENEIARPVVLFAYPYGDLNPEVVTTVRSAGYAGAVTLQYGSNNTRSDPFLLRRALVPNQMGVRFRAGLQMRTSIFGELLRQGYNLLGSLRRSAATRKAGAKEGTVAPCGS
jgi:peptidoglycan/xylan/chitin deacetylase (PgdA/CDA1 family)